MIDLDAIKARYCGAFIKQADADFMAHAREDIPALVAEVEQLRLTLEQALTAMSATVSEIMATR